MNIMLESNIRKDIEVLDYKKFFTWSHPDASVRNKSSTFCIAVSSAKFNSFLTQVFACPLRMRGGGNGNELANEFDGKIFEIPMLTRQKFVWDGFPSI